MGIGNKDAARINAERRAGSVGRVHNGRGPLAEFHQMRRKLRLAGESDAEREKRPPNNKSRAAFLA